MDISSQDIKSIALALVTMILAYGVKRLWLFYARKSISSRLSELNQDAAWLERMGNCFEEKVLFCFRLLFSITLLIGISFTFEHFLNFVINQSRAFSFVNFLVWILVVSFSCLAISKLNQLRNYDESKEKLEQKVKLLESRLAELDKNNS